MAGGAGGVAGAIANCSASGAPVAAFVSDTVIPAAAQFLFVRYHQQRVALPPPHVKLHVPSCVAKVAPRAVFGAHAAPASSVLGAARAAAKQLAEQCHRSVWRTVALLQRGAHARGLRGHKGKLWGVGHGVVSRAHPRVPIGADCGGNVGDATLWLRRHPRQRRWLG
jgi:hypothetical protein